MDVIQFGKERVPFSRENLKKAIAFLDNRAQRMQENSVGSPYVGLAEKTNPTTSSGFLGNTLNIQDRYRFPQMSNGSMYVSASKRFDDLMEKIATMQEFDWNSVQKFFLMKEAREKQAEIDGYFELAKNAGESNIGDVISRTRNVKWKDIGDIPNKGYITFPELKNGNELSMTFGVVFKEFVFPNRNHPESEIENTYTVVLAQDGRMRILQKGEKMLCMSADKNAGRFKTKSFDSLKKADMFMMFYKDSVTFPMKVDDISVRNDAANEHLKVKKYTVSDINYSGKEFFYNKPENAFMARRYFTIVPSEGVAKFCEVTKDELANLKSRDSVVSRRMLRDMLPSESKLYSINPKQYVLCICGTIDTFFKDKKEMEFILSNMSDLKDDMAFLKTAMENEYVTVQCMDKDAGRYSVSLHYNDKSKRMFVERIKRFDNIDPGKVRGILHAIGFSVPRTQELLQKAKLDRHITVSLPQGFDADKITGAKSKSAAMQRFNRARKNVFSNKDVQTIAAKSLGYALTDTPIAKSETVRKIVLNKAASNMEESRALAKVFEKLAMEHESPFYRDIAKAMFIESELMNKTAEILEHDKQYPQIVGVCEKIASDKDYLDYLASGLTMLKTAQYQADVHDVNPNYFAGAVYHLDTMYKTACEFTKRAADDEDEDEDDRPLNQKMKSSDVATAEKINEKEDVPFGKMTPTKFVQRKNSQRYQY